jgi:hypothetical protein
MPLIEFKEHPLYMQWISQLLDSRLRIITYALSGFVYDAFGKTLTITGIYRTQDEQNAIYKDNEDYQKDPWLSFHQFWRGIYFRSIYFTDPELTEIEQFLNNNFLYDKIGAHKTALIHNIGVGNHLHVQVSNEQNTSIIKA